MNAIPKPETVRLSDEEVARLRENMRQRDAIFRLEGFEPNADTRAIDEAILAGRVTAKQAADEMVAYVRQHKTVDGFIQSRSWA